MKPTSSFAQSTTLSRRKFLLAGSAVAATVSIVPRHVLGGPGFVAPSEKLRVANIGCGTQGLREMPDLLNTPEVQVVAVCDPIRESWDYIDWSKDGLRSSLADALGDPAWGRKSPGIPGGREVAKDYIERFYAKSTQKEKYKGCAVYADFRELLGKERDLDAVKIMTPDHLHATIAIPAMKRGLHVIMHKPLANRLAESRMVIEVARKTRVGTYFLPASDGANIRTIKSWIDAGAIGKLREIHNWSNRPVWPQYPTIPTDSPPVPDGFDWNLWLGPSLDRPYHPHYTHAVFRGWYEFGGGAIADMGHYSLWPVFRLFDLDSPVVVESRASHLCTLSGNVSHRIANDYSFPAACTLRFRFAAKGDRQPLDLFWYDGSMKPPVPEELEAEEKDLPAEGMMFVGDKGKVLSGFLGDDPRILSTGTKPHLPAAPLADRRRREKVWVASFKEGKPSYADFLLAGPIADTFNLGAVSLRLGGIRLAFDSSAAKITNLPEANKYLTREYRPGWALTET